MRVKLQIIKAGKKLHEGAYEIDDDGAEIRLRSI